MTTSQLSETRPVQASISVQIPGGEYITRRLRGQETVSVGSDGTAELRLESDGVAGMHCLLSVENDSVTIKDCYSSTGTFVDGERVQEVTLQHDCEIRVGGNVIAVKLVNGKPRPQNFHAVTPPPVQSVDLIQDESVNDVQNEESSLTWSEEPDSVYTEDRSSQFSDLSFELEQANSEIIVLRERLESSRKSVGPTDPDPFQQEMIELLRTEVIALQDELAKQVADSTSLENCSSYAPSDDLPSREEVEKLVDRLESLLEELQQKDEHTQVLQDLILASDHANQAEQEEREQLASWLGEFEQRFEMISEEWQAETDQLTKKIQALEQERDEAQAALSADTGSAKSEALKRLAETLRTQINDQQSEVEQLQERNAELKTSLMTAQSSTTREEEVRLSRERAEIARMRHDVEVRKQKLHDLTEESPNVNKNTSDAEQKLQDFRDHLRESGKYQKSAPSLSSRFQSIWKRLN